MPRHRQPLGEWQILRSTGIGGDDTLAALVAQTAMTLLIATDAVRPILKV